MKAIEAARRINQTAARLSGGYTVQTAHGQFTTAFCDTLPAIRKTKSGRFSINDTSGNGEREIYDTLSEAVVAAINWFASSFVGYTIERGRKTVTTVVNSWPEVTTHTETLAADRLAKEERIWQVYFAVATGHSNAWDRFRGFK